MKRAVLIGAGLLAFGLPAFWLWGPCGSVRASAARDELESLSERWQDAVQVAGAAPMIALAGPLGRLQDIRRETKDLRVPDCAEHARGLLAKNMDITIEAIVAVMASPLERRDAARDALGDRMDSAAEKFRDFNSEMSRLASCAPICDGLLATALGRD